MVAVFMMLFSMTSYAAWVEADNGRLQWEDKNGNIYIDTIFEYDNNAYYVDGNGYQVRNLWIERPTITGEYESRWYFFGRDGKALKDTKKNINNKWYVFESYYMHEDEGLFWWDGHQFYCYGKGDGKLAADEFVNIGDDTYYFDENAFGIFSSWLYKDYSNYYFGPDFKMVKGEIIQIGNELCYFDSKGICYFRKPIIASDSNASFR